MAGPDDQGPAVVAARHDLVDLVVALGTVEPARAMLGREQPVRAHLPVEALGVAVPDRDDLRATPCSAVLMRRQREELAVQRVPVLGELGLTGVTGGDVETAIGTERDAPAVVHLARLDAGDERCLT